MASPRGEAFAWHDRDGAFGRLAPPFAPAELVEMTDGIRDGSRVTIRLPAPVGPMGLTWVAEHSGYREGERFVDDQVKGPFAHWHHEHLFEDAGGEGAFVMRDRVSYRLPMGALGRLALPIVRPKLEAMFRYRHATLEGDLALHAEHREAARKTVLITGGTGLIGSALASLLTTGGHRVRVLTRGSGRGRAAQGAMAYRWDPATGEVDPAALDGVDAVVHLAGEQVFSPRWSGAKRRRILESRVAGTRAIVAAMRASAQPPACLVSASAVGFYGARGEERVDEAAASGEGFLAEVCRAWEGEARAAEDAGIRTVRARIGVVLTPRGGALGLMAPAAKAGLGARIGGGRQYVPWIGIDDAIGGLYHLVMSEGVSGAVNLVAPGCVRQREFVDTLARVVRRPRVLAAPAWAVRMMLGEVAEEMVLKGCLVEPGVLVASGYRFRHERLDGALYHLLGMSPKPSSPEPSRARP